MATMIRTRKLIASITLACCFFSSCDLLSPKEDPAPSGSLELGGEVLLSTATIGSSGGNVSVSGADTLNGLGLSVPANTYADQKTFTISYVPIKSSSLSDKFKIISPIIRIRNGGGFAENLMKLKIPVEIPDDQFAMAFSYNKEDGSLEGMPLIDEDAHSITISSRHFEHSTVFKEESRAKAKGGIVLADLAETDLLVATMSKAAIFAETPNSGFAPRVDDWRFFNYGSQVAPGGHCAGQSLGMMYYYMVQKKSHHLPPLYGRYDNNDLFPTPNVQYDDRNAYSFCSVLQKNWPNWNIGIEMPKSDSLTFMAFKFAMIAAPTRPQFISIWTDNTFQHGHAMVIYAATANTLKICDPNFPGVLDRKVEFVAGKFKPYDSGSDAAHLGTAYPIILYAGITSHLNWRIAHKEWKNFLNSTVGQGFFTSYIIKSRDTETAEFGSLTQGWKTKTGKVQFQTSYAGERVNVKWVYRQSQDTIQGHGGWYDIPDGLNWIGLYLTNDSGRWAGFKWVEIEGKNGPPPARCETVKSWETLLGAANVTYTDSLALTGERVVYLEDLGSPEDICSDEHIHPKWEMRGSLDAFKISAYAYWSLFGRELQLSANPPGVYSGEMEIGLKQAFDQDPGYIGLQYRIKFPSRGTLATDLKYLFDHLTSAKISLTYREHRL